MPDRTPRVRRAGPIADGLSRALVALRDELAKGWLLALFERAPLAEAAAAVSVERLAADGPEVCEALARALGDESSLLRLSADRLVSGVGSVAGGSTAAAVVEAVDVLGEVVWAALRRELVDAEGDEVAAVAARLALVLGVVRAAALRGFAGVEAGDDEWLAMLELEVRQRGGAGGGVAFLVVELEDVARMPAVDGEAAARGTVEGFHAAVRASVRRQDAAVREGEGRVWIVAGGLERATAETLAERVAAAVWGLPEWRGAPPAASVGIGIVGEDGDDVGEVVGAAEEARFAALAEGVAVVRGGQAPG